VYVLAGTIVGILAIILFQNFLKRKQRHILYLAFIWSFCGVYCIFEGLSFVFMSNFFQLTSLVWGIIPISFFLIMVIDSISRETPDPLKIAIFCVFATLTVTFSFDPDAVAEFTYPNGDQGLTWAGRFSLAAGLMSLIFFFLAFVIAARIYKNAPRSLKNSSLLLLIGGLLNGIIIPVISFLGLDTLFPYFNDATITVITAVLWSIAFLRSPQIAYVLPCNVLRLAAIDTTSGIPLYSYTWSKATEIVNDTLFSGMLHAISGILNEALHGGDIEEIKLTREVILLRRSAEYPVACILVATKSTPSLRNALRAFAGSFFERFSQCFANMNNVSQFSTAAELVENYFSFIPSHDK